MKLPLYPIIIFYFILGAILLIAPENAVSKQEMPETPFTVEEWQEIRPLIENIRNAPSKEEIAELKRSNEELLELLK